MTSIAHLTANIANAQHSTGPRTDAGKQRTRLNAYRHGLTGQICIFTPEEQAAFDRHCAGIREDIDPVGAQETGLAQAIAEDRWRLNRARSLENGIFALGQRTVPPNPDPGQTQIDEALAQARTWLADGRNLQLLSLYEQRIHRAIEKNKAELAALQASRQAVVQKALEEAQLLAQLAYSKGESYSAADDFPAKTLRLGSDFSTPALNRQILLARRLIEARYHAACNWKRKIHFEKPYLQIPDVR